MPHWLRLRATTKKLTARPRRHHGYSASKCISFPSRATSRRLRQRGNSLGCFAWRSMCRWAPTPPSRRERWLRWRSRMRRRASFSRAIYWRSRTVTGHRWRWTASSTNGTSRGRAVLHAVRGPRTRAVDLSRPSARMSASRTGANAQQAGRDAATSVMHAESRTLPR